MVQQLFNGYEPNKIYATDNYNMFSFILGNRAIEMKDVRRLEILIKLHGQEQPIFVNEKMEIIDGQHRFCACKNLGRSVEFIIRPGTNAANALNSNTGGHNWNIDNRIGYYAQTENEDYKILWKWRSENPDIPATVIAAILRGSLENRYMYISEDGKLTTHKNRKKGVEYSTIGNDVQVGEFKIRDLVSARNRIEAIRTILDVLPAGKTSKGKAASALIKIMRNEHFDYKRLAERIQRLPSYIHPVTTTDECVKMFDEVYNYNKRGKNRTPLYEYDSRRK